jgi:predicted N-acetyltransferase YhbS
MLIRELVRDEIEQIWDIDRREVIEAVYYLVDGQLVLRPEHYDMQGWPPGEAEKYTPILLENYDRGGVFFGAFEDGRLVGVAVLEKKFIGQPRDQLQLSFLHVSRDYRGKGVGKRLFELAKEHARQMGASRLYVSATPSEHTVNFYLSLGCTVALLPDPELFAREPEDIHLEYSIVEL